MKIVVAMSGGVDSSTAAGLLVEAGHEVIGLAMKTHGLPKSNRACCTPDDMRDARRVADFLDIPFYVLNYEDLFHEAVVQPFAEAYRTGRTPNPCIECNDKVKFRTLLERARLLGADLLATGHYARLGEDAGRPRLLRGSDRHKDQSYFLYRLSEAQLEQVCFPVGHMQKAEVRQAARRLGLPVADKAESQEICFVGAAGYPATVESLLGAASPGAGDLVDGTGRVLGRHAGVHHFTIGQRRGLKLAAPEPLYVTGIDAEGGRVSVGSRDDLLVSEVGLEDIVGEMPAEDEVVGVQQRYREAPRPARVVRHAGRVRLRFLQPEPRGAPGQAAVIYRGEMVLGGGVVGASTSTASRVATAVAEA